MPVKVRSVSQILSEMVRRVLAETPLTDVSAGSVLSTILEAAAVSDFQNNLSVLKILESSRIESLVGTDLDNKAIEMAVPDGVGGFGRKPATRSNGTVTIGSGFTKKASSLYLAKPSPYVGTTVIYVQDASGWPATGQVYIGRGSLNEEGPLSYTSITHHVNYYSIQLAAGNQLIKNHKYEEQVVLAQGGIRTVSAGTAVVAPAADDSPQVLFYTDALVTLLDGESEADVAATASEFGESGNVAAGAVKAFTSAPFTGATVTNGLSFTNGQPSESDEQLRQRIRNHYASLSRGTRLAIVGALQGLRDPSSGKTITSVNLVEPISAGEAAKCFVDDGSGLEPSYEGQTYENLLNSAYGQEVLFRTSKYPVTACLLESTKLGPYQLTPGWTLIVKRDGITETFTVRTEDYRNINSVQADEIVNAFNSQAVKVGFRTSGGSQYVTVFDLIGDAETLSVYPGELQELLGFPTAETRSIFLYLNNELLSFKGKTATLQTSPFPWGSLSAGDMSNVVVSVDGVQQTFTVTDLDFQVYGTSVTTASLSQWAEVFAKKVAGVHVYEDTSADNLDVLIWKSWQDQSASGSVEIVSGGWIGTDKMWPTPTAQAPLYDVGAAADFDFNRISGQIRLVNPPTFGDNVALGSQLTRASVYSLSSQTGVFGAGVSDYGNPVIIVGFDGNFVNRVLNIPNNTAVTATRLGVDETLVELDFGSTGYFTEIESNDWIYLVRNISHVSPVPADLVGLYRVKSTDGQRLYIIADDASAAIFDGTTINISPDTMYAFKSEGVMPQAVDLGGAAVFTVDDLVSTINTGLVGGEAVKISPRKFMLRSYNYDNLTSTVAVFVSIGTAYGIIQPAVASALQPHTAYKHSSKIDGGFVKVTSIDGPTLPADFYSTYGAMKFEPTYTEILDDNLNPTARAYSSVVNYPIGLQEFAITTKDSGFVSRIYNNATVAPFTGFAQGDDTYKPPVKSVSASSLVRYEGTSIRLEDLPISYTDKLVVEMDADPVNGISSVAMGKRALVSSMSSITGGAKGSQITFTLKDPEDPVMSGFKEFFDASSSYRDFDFTDFNALFRSFCFNSVYEEDTMTKLPIYANKHTFALYSTQFGKTSRVCASIIYASTPNSSTVQIFHKNYYVNSANDAVANHVYMILPSGNVEAVYNKSYTVQPMDYDVPDFGSKIVKLVIQSYDGLPINPISEFKVGSTLVIGGAHDLYSGSFPIISASATEIHVAAPGVRLASYPLTPTRLEPAVYPLFSMANPGASIADLSTAINVSYFADNPVVTLKVLTTDPTIKVKYPTYFVQGQTTANTSLTSVSASIDYHAVLGSFSGIANIHTYDAIGNQIIATVQSDEALLPTTAQISGTTYSYVNEECYLVPANARAMKHWMNFTAVSGLSTRCFIESVKAQDTLQLASLEYGSKGAVAVTGVTANTQTINLINVPTDGGQGSITCAIEFASAQSLPRGALVEVTNAYPVTIGRAYRSTPSNITGYSAITAFNTADINTHFRDTTEVEYSQVTLGVGQFTFKRSSSGYVGGSSSIRITGLTGTSVMKVEATGSNQLNARVGDMLVINSTLADPIYSCVAVAAPLKNGYIGYPVVHVESLDVIYCLAPNAITTPTNITLTAETDLMFVPMVVAEKNIKTNYMPGIKFSEKEVGKDSLYYRICPIGNGMVYAEFSYGDLTTHYPLDMKLDAMSVSSDDWIEFSDGFLSANTGKFRLVAHNGVNAVVFHNHVSGGVQELSNTTQYWGAGPIGDGDTVNTDKRHVRIWDAESVSVGDRLTITSPKVGASTWFSNSLIGTWAIKELGIDSNYNVYVICDIPSAPATPETVVLGASASSVYFQERAFASTESARSQGYKWVVGHAHSAGNASYSDIYVAPQTSLRRMLPVYGTALNAVSKLGYSSTPEKGLDAYRYYTELIAQAHKVIDGSAANPIDYPGVRAVGSAIEILPPLIKSISASLTVVPNEGVDLNSIKLPVKSAITSYVNSLGVGQEVVVSEMIRRVQQVPGVRSVIIESTSPNNVDGVISTGSYEVARVVDQSDISI
jgi:hypothetical protein